MRNVVKLLKVKVLIIQKRALKVLKDDIVLLFYLSSEHKIIICTQKIYVMTSQQSFNLIGLISSRPENTCEAFNLFNKLIIKKYKVAQMRHTSVQVPQSCTKVQNLGWLSWITFHFLKPCTLCTCWVEDDVFVLKFCFFTFIGWTECCIFFNVCFSCVDRVLSLPPAGPGGSLLRSGGPQETFLLRLQEANGGKHGAALRRSDQFHQQLNQFRQHLMWSALSINVLYSF